LKYCITYSGINFAVITLAQRFRDLANPMVFRQANRILQIVQTLGPALPLHNLKKPETALGATWEFVDLQSLNSAIFNCLF
jgi:hypothetical protein